MSYSYGGADRRKYLRHPKKYSLFFYFKDSPGKRSNETLIKDISKGGVRFTTSQPIKPGTPLIFEISIPYIAPKKLVLEGLVVSGKEITSGMVYEVRASFAALDTQAMEVLNIVEKQSLKGS